MARPCKRRWVGEYSAGRMFKHAGTPTAKLKLVELQLDELEAFRQAHLLDKTQEQGAAEMGISRSTFARILASASRKIARTLVEGGALVINGGPVIMKRRQFRCDACGHQWEESFGTGRPEACPECHSLNFGRIDAGPRGVCGGRGMGYGRGAGGSRQNRGGNRRN